MYIRVKCPGCGTRLRGKPELAGLQVNCPKCGQQLWLDESGKVKSNPTPKENGQKDVPTGDSQVVTTATAALKGGEIDGRDNEEITSNDSKLAQNAIAVQLLDFQCKSRPGVIVTQAKC